MIVTILETSLDPRYRENFFLAAEMRLLKHLYKALRKRGEKL